MSKQLKNFIICVENIPQLRKIFVSCKNLEESYNKFKIMLNGCTWSEYKKFFKELMENRKYLGDEELSKVAGGISLRKLSTPLAIMALLTGTGASFVFASEPSAVQNIDESISYEQQLDADDAMNGSTDSEETKNSHGIPKGEIEFGLKIIESMPKKGDPNFENFLELPNQSKLDEAREITVNYKNGPSETKIINEKEIYKEIERVVNELIDKVNRRTPTEDMSEDEIQSKIAKGELSKHYKISKQMRIAKAIYMWVEKNIKVDHDSDTSNPENYDYRKGQDAISVFYHKMAVCMGYSRLVNLMMKMAGIPSAYVQSGYHAFNVIYLEDEDNEKTGWTVVEPTWGAQLKQGDYFKEGWSVKTFFPGFYNKNDSLREANRSILQQPDHHVMDIGTSTTIDEGWGDEYFYNFKIDNISYYLYGTDGEGLIAISGDKSNPAENLVMPEEISSLNLPFRINEGIKSIILKGNERFIGLTATESAQNLDYIQFGNIKCRIARVRKYGGEIFPVIWSDESTPVENLRIPDTLVELDTPIVVDYGIKSIVLTGDECVLVEGAVDLKDIDATKSNIYIVEDGTLYEKTASGEKGERIVKIGEHVSD